MPYISSLLGKPVADVDGERAGRLDDLIASLKPEMRHPEIVALRVERRRRSLLVPLADVAALLGPACSLSPGLAGIVPYQPTGTDLSLAQDVLDKQIIDTTAMRVVRVNDLELVRAGSRYYVANVDIGGIGLMRRLGLAGLIRPISRRLGREMRSNTIPWDAVELLPGGTEMRLRVPGEKIAELDPADLAEIISDLTRAESSLLLETLDVKVVADALEEVEPDFQASLVETMPDEKVADLLEEMAPDEAADLLAELPKTRSQELLRLMQREVAEDVRRLLTFPEDTAGGIMTTEFAAVPPDLTAEQALAVLRETAEEAETIFYVYVVDKAGCLVGWLSLSDLVLARPSTKVTDLMQARSVSIQPGDSQNTVAQTVIKYNLLAAPVIDYQGRLQGIVTSDDALDKIIPTAWKKRLPSMYRWAEPPAASALAGRRERSWSMTVGQRLKPVQTRLVLLLAVVGPGIITANADNDAGGITTYSVAGAHYGYSLLWIMPLVALALIVVQEMSARLGVATGRGLAAVIREVLGVRAAAIILSIVMLANLANTISEFAGVAASLEVFGVSKYISVPLAALGVWLLIVKGNYRLVERVFLAASAIFLAYVVSGIMARLAITIVGTTIAPWMQFYQPSAIADK